METLLLNSFPVELSPIQVKLPYVEYRTWEDSRHDLIARYSNYSTYRLSTPDGTIRLFLLNGPAVSESIETAEIDFARAGNLAGRLIERSLGRYFSSLGMQVSSGSFGTVALRPQADFSRNGIDLRAGICFQARRPFRDQPYGFSLTVTWEARASFRESLMEPTIQKIALDMPVLYKPARPAPPELATFSGRYLGHVQGAPTNTDAAIYCRDRELRRIPLGDLFLEASAESIRKYEQAIGIEHQSASVWRAVQELSLVVTKAGRRNPSVLRDRLSKVIAFLGNSSKDRLVVPMDTYEVGTVTVGLTPARVPVEHE